MRILQGKFHWIKSKMRAENAESQSEFNWIWSRIRMEAKVSGKKEEKVDLKEKICKIWEFYKERFTESDLKWKEKMQNSNVNSTKFDWRFKWKWKWEKREKKKVDLKEKIYITWRKFHNFTKENSLNQIWNEKRKCRICRWIQRNSIEDSNQTENGRKEEEKNNTWKRKFAKFGKNSTILQRKTHWIRSEMRKENAEFVC